MDKEWTKLPRFCPEYIMGVHRFLDFAYTNGRPQGDEMLCPCTKCRNRCWTTRNVILDHLVAKGFLQGYDVWVHHGEQIGRHVEVDDNMADIEDPLDDIGGLLHDAFQNVAEGAISEGPNEDARKFYNLVNEAKQELYPGCKDFSTLSFMIRLYLLKCLHGWSNASFTALLDSRKTQEQPIKNRAIANDNPKAKQPAMKKQQPMKNIVTGIDNSKEKEQRMDGVVAEDVESGTMQESARKKTKKSPMCRATSIDEFLRENGENGEEEEEEPRDESSDEEDIMRQEENAQEEEEGGETNGASKKRTRGPTQKLKIHARNIDDREEVVLDDDGEPIGPNDQTVFDLSNFLGTVARNSDLCPLIFTNFKVLVKENGDRIWDYVNI